MGASLRDHAVEMTGKYGGQANDLRAMVVVCRRVGLGGKSCERRKTRDAYVANHIDSNRKEEQLDDDMVSTT